MLNLVTILVIPVLPLSKLTSDSSNDIVIIIYDGVLEHWFSMYGVNVLTILKIPMHMWVDFKTYDNKNT